MTDKLSKEELLEECELALNSAVAKAHQQYPYRKKRIEQAREQIVALIQKPEITEEWIEEKTKEMVEIIKNYCFSVGELRNARPDAMSFIRSLVEEGK